MVLAYKLYITLGRTVASGPLGLAASRFICVHPVLSAVKSPVYSLRSLQCNMSISPKAARILTPFFKPQNTQNTRNKNAFFPFRVFRVFRGKNSPSCFAFAAAWLRPRRAVLFAVTLSPPHGERNANAGKFRTTPKITAITSHGSRWRGVKNGGAGRWRSRNTPSQPARAPSAAAVSRNSALSRHAACQRPCSRAYTARVAPQPGQFHPVSR